MFTGIVEEIGTVHRCRPHGSGFELAIDCAAVLEGTAVGDSIAVDGVCLTVTALDDTGFVTGLAPETRARTTLDRLAPGERVNLERSVTPSTRLGGHLVQGHVDATGTIASLHEDADALRVTVEAPPSTLRYIVSKGYVALDGTSLTVVDVGESSFSVTLVAHTRAHVVLPTKGVGERVNIEVDVLGRYVERLLAGRLDEGVGTGVAGATDRAIALDGEIVGTHGRTVTDGGRAVAAARTVDGTRSALPPGAQRA